MKLLITGATGFVGSHTAEHLLEEGHQLRALVRPSSDLKWLKGKDIEPVISNMLDPESLRDALTGIEGVIHIAGVVASKTKQGFYDGNQLFTRDLLEAVKRYAPELNRFVIASSATAGGPSLDGQPITENIPPHPITTYGRSKLAAEEEGVRYRDHFPVTILRLPVVYGPRDTATLSFFQAISRRIKPLIGFDDKWVNLLHAKDVARGITLGLTSPAAENQLYYIGSDKQYNWRQLSDIAAAEMNKKGIFIRVPHVAVTSIAGLSEFFSMFKKKPSVLNWEKRHDLIQKYWTFSSDRAARELGFRQHITVEDGFRDTIEWYKREKWL